MASFTDTFNFSRTSVGWCFDASGNLVQVASGLPRFCRSALDNQPSGLLIEPARTESIPFTTVTSTRYAAANGATITDQTLSVFGQFPGLLIASGGLSSAIARSQASAFFPVVSGESRTVEVYYQMGTSPSMACSVINNSVSTSTIAGVPGSQTVTSTAAGSITFVSDDLLLDGVTRRLRFRWFPNFTNSNAVVALGPNSTTVGHNIIWLAAFSQAARVFTTPILTNGDSVTRAIEALTVKNTSTWFNSQEGTFVGHFRFHYDDNDTFNEVPMFRINQGAFDSIGHSAYISTSGTNTGRVTYRVQTSASTTVPVSLATAFSPGYNRVIKIACSYSSSEVKMAFNGSSVFSLTPTGVMPDMSTFLLTLGGGAPITVLNFDYRPTESDNATLTALTV